MPGEAPGSVAAKASIAHITSARGPGGRGGACSNEESPGSMELRCRVTPGGGPSPGERSSGTVPQKGHRPPSDGQGRKGAARAHRGFGNKAGTVNPTGCKTE